MSTNNSTRSRLVIPATASDSKYLHDSTRNFSKSSSFMLPSDAESESLVLDREACLDLFEQFAVDRDGEACLDWHDIRRLLVGIGEEPKDETIRQLFEVADEDGNGVIDVEEFIEHAGTFMGGNPARIILIVGGPGSGKGVLCKRLEQECNVVHLSSGDMLRCEVSRNTALGRQVRDIMSRGELVSSAIMVALMKKRMRDHPGKRVLLDGFPRSLENAHDLVTLCGKPELALHLQCEDTFLMERVMGRGASSGEGGQVRREDDNFQTALQRLRTYHKYHHVTMELLREQHVPIVNLDCSGSAESVWDQLKAIGRLMRPAVKSRNSTRLEEEASQLDREDWSNDPSRTSLF
jgi:adenylate kinase